MRDTRIQIFDYLYAKTSTEITLQEWAHRITSPTPTIEDRIKRIRAAGKGSDLYDELKRGLPNVLVNVRTTGRALNDHITGYNDLLFVDIDRVAFDDVEQVKQELAAKFPSLLLCWRSSGGKGISGVLHVKGTNENTFPALDGYFRPLRIAGYPFDLTILTKTRKTYQSYDANLFTNWDAPALDLSALGNTTAKDRQPKTKKGAVGTTSLVPSSLRVIVPTAPFSGSLRFDNIADFFPGDLTTPHLHFPEGVGIIAVERRWVKVDQERNVWLFKNLVRVRYLNPSLSFAHLCTIAGSMNRNAIATPMSEQEVRKVATNVFRGGYIPQANVTRKVLFNPAIKRSGKDRQQASRTIIGKARGNKIEQSIHDAIVGYEGSAKITAKLIASITGLSLDSVKRKWTTFRDLASNYNQDLKTPQRGPLQGRSEGGVIIQMTNQNDTMNNKDQQTPKTPVERLTILRHSLSHLPSLQDLRAWANDPAIIARAELIKQRRAA